MTFNDGHDIDPCRVSVNGRYPDGCPQDPPYGEPNPPGHDGGNSLMSMAHDSFHPFGMSISPLATTASLALFAGTVVLSSYRRTLGQLLTSRAMAPFVTKSVYDKKEGQRPPNSNHSG